MAKVDGVPYLPVKHHFKRTRSKFYFRTFVSLCQARQICANKEKKTGNQWFKWDTVRYRANGIPQETIGMKQYSISS
ncbi:MAG: hypothetical protein LCI00_27455, partial [Chloroflexi bacterium]|nr:hypothetical protein [Chloroflexota bacterium]